MTRRVPIIATAVVGAAIAVMIGLGVWQLQRAQWKQALLTNYAKADSLPPIAWPNIAPKDAQLPLFRHATGVCLRIAAKRAQAGENMGGDAGYVHIADCVTGAEGPGMSVELGWSKNPNAPFHWSGGPVSGVIAPDRQARMRLVAASAPPGLEQSKPPSLSAIPNNHRFYAFQWFFFAAAAAVIYALAVRKRWNAIP
ncbi:MAG TPA: SURF1 family cytochrome oxidase biogenesis protein [Sphingomicrobium sp.]|nr:SURF1 family cytochrome oxidase biogenesis protein [Sphingomicrobium sp.]